MTGHVPDDPLAKTNYRQVGCVKIDRVRPKTGSCIASMTSIPSIPSRYTKSTGGAYGESPPGPGAYFKPSTMERSAEECGSVSRKGYSVGFVSKTKRFNYEKQLIENSGPGPGQYLMSNNNNGIEDGKGSAIFGGANRPRTCIFDVIEKLPGPGEYEVDKKTRQEMKRALEPNATFKSKAPRYVPGADRKSYGNSNSNNSGTSVSGSSGSFPGDNNYRSSKSQHRVRRLPDPCFRSSTARSAAFTSDNHVPGVGEYEIEESLRMLQRRSKFQDKGSSVFVGLGLDRFGVPVLARTEKAQVPGPGEYTADLLANDKRNSKPHASSMFAGTIPKESSRDDQVVKSMILKAPGPAFYDPAVPQHKSFHLNLTKRWI